MMEREQCSKIEMIPTNRIYASHCTIMFCGETDNDLEDELLELISIIAEMLPIECIITEHRDIGTNIDQDGCRIPFIIAVFDVPPEFKNIVNKYYRKYAKPYVNAKGEYDNVYNQVLFHITCTKRNSSKKSLILLEKYSVGSMVTFDKIQLRYLNNPAKDNHVFI